MNTNQTFYRRATRSALVLTVLLGTSLLLSACNTTAGVGEDVSAGGHAVTRSAEQAKQAL